MHDIYPQRSLIYYSTIMYIVGTAFNNLQPHFGIFLSSLVNLNCFFFQSLFQILLMMRNILESAPDWSYKTEWSSSSSQTSMSFSSAMMAEVSSPILSCSSSSLPSTLLSGRRFPFLQSCTIMEGISCAQVCIHIAPYRRLLPPPVCFILTGEHF